MRKIKNEGKAALLLTELSSSPLEQRKHRNVYDHQAAPDNAHTLEQALV